jgi:LCP family protein required for cell wall assembly
MSSKQPKKSTQKISSSKNLEAKPPKHVWRWVLGGIGLVVLGVGIFTALRVTSFAGSTFGGRDEGSLLEPTATLPPTTTPRIAPTVPLNLNEPTPVAIPTVTPQPTTTPLPSTPIIRKIINGERFSVLILGYGGEGHEGPYLTDTILQVVYDPSKKTVTNISIPRDLYTFISYGENKGVGVYQKVNYAFAHVMGLPQPNNSLNKRYRFDPNDVNSKIDASAILAKDTVEQITGIPVDYWMAVNFNGFRQLIDALGGITVNVEKAFDDYEYPANDNPAIDASVIHLRFEAGTQKMNGERAIQYSRSRKSAQDGGDIARSKRQMKVIQAVKEEALKTENLLKAYSIMDALQGNIRTSLPFGDSLMLANFFNSSEGRKYVDNLYFVNSPLDDAFLYSSNNEAGFVFIPRAGVNQYKPIREWLKQGLQAPQLRAENLKVQIQNATGQNKYANDVTQLLSKQGFSVAPFVWANPTTTTQIIDYSEGKADYTLKQLQSNFPDAVVKTAQPPYKGYVGPQLVVVLGKDFIRQEEARNRFTNPQPNPDDSEQNSRDEMLFSAP